VSDESGVFSYMMFDRWWCVVFYLCTYQM